MAKKNSLRLCILLISITIFSGCNSVGFNPEVNFSPSLESIVIDNVSPSDRIQIEDTVRDKDGMVQLSVPGGIYLQGSTEEDVAVGINLCQQHYQPCNSWYYEREFPPHEVTLSPFLIDQSEVTNQQFQSCVEAGSCTEPMVCKKGEPTYQDSQKADHPVVCVSWEEAKNYCEWVGGRLPTEAEWEYAFRGEESLIFPWGDEFVGSNLNFCDVNCDQGHADDAFDDGYKRTAPVGSIPSGVSWSGLNNQGGNVSEWVSDWFGEYEPGDLKNPTGPTSGTQKLIKGCSWYSPAAYCRGAARGSVDPDTRFDYLGFRCAASSFPVIDGVLQPGEWDQADLFHFEDESELFLLQKGGYLYLAVRAGIDEMIAGNVFLQNGNQIFIMHTSAALGTAIYQEEGDSWVKIQDFEWCCRSKIESEAAREDREIFFNQDGWLGINSFNGNENELEYKIRLTGTETYLAVNFLSADTPGLKLVWPIGLVDGPAQPVDGGFPELMDFSPENWLNLEELP